MDDSPQFSFEFSAEAPSRRIYGVRELVASVRTHLEKGFPDVWVEGEISNYRPADSGHLYLTLKDGDSQLRVVMFRAQARLLRFRPQNGMQVITRGRVTLYEARGEMQLLAEFMEPMGAGALQVAFEQLKAKLAAEGLFAQERKKPLPALPRRIGVMIVGDEVPHVHLHVVPFDAVSELSFAHADPNPPAGSLEAAAAKLRAALRELGAEHVSE